MINNKTTGKCLATWECLSQKKLNLATAPTWQLLQSDNAVSRLYYESIPQMKGWKMHPFFPRSGTEVKLCACGGCTCFNIVCQDKWPVKRKARSPVLKESWQSHNPLHNLPLTVWRVTRGMGRVCVWRFLSGVRNWRISSFLKTSAIWRNILVCGPKYSSNWFFGETLAMVLVTFAL